jgi:hypothetical protein
VGLKIRDESDSSPPLITGNSEVIINANPQSDNTNVISKLWTMVMDKVTDVMDYVMDESIDGDECDECDGKNKKSPEFQEQVKETTQCSTINEDNSARLAKGGGLGTVASPNPLMSLSEN